MMKHVHGGDVYKYKNCLDFSANCNPLGTPERVKQAIIESVERLEDYPEVGCGRLKEAIARYEQVEKEEVICGNGAAELIFSLCRAKKPKKALLPAPTFAEYEQALSSVGCEIRYFFLEEKEDFRVKEAYLEALTDDLDILFLCNPNNPTGILMERDFLEKVLIRCRDKGIFAVVDECFLDFIREPENYTLKAYLKEYKNLFILKAFTKRYAIAGVRLGYGLCADERILGQMELMTQPWNVSAMAQAAGLAALKETDYVEAGRKLVFEEAAYLKREMEKLGLKVFPSQANYIFFKGPENLFEQCVEKGILIRDCSNYPGLSKGYFRVAVKRHERNVKLIEALKEIVQK